MNEDKAIGITGVLILFSFSQFFFQRRKLIFTLQTIIYFYIFGILSTLFISYTFLYTQYDWLMWLFLFQIYIFIEIIGRTTILTNKGIEDLESIGKEKENQKWYHKIWATNTQQKENKLFILDLFVFIVFIILVLFIKDIMF